MTRWLQAAIQAQDPKAKTDETDGTRAKDERAGHAAQPKQVLSVVSVLSAGSERETPPARTAPSVPVVPLHGRMVVTWCGVWVSRKEWNVMTDLERHGPQGRLFCGKCWQWQDRDAGLACLHGRPCQ